MARCKIIKGAHIAVGLILELVDECLQAADLNSMLCIQPSHPKLHAAVNKYSVRETEHEGVRASHACHVNHSCSSSPSSCLKPAGTIPPCPPSAEDP